GRRSDPESHKSRMADQGNSNGSELDLDRLMEYDVAPERSKHFILQILEMNNNHCLISTRLRLASLLVALFIALMSAATGSVFAQQFSSDLFQSLHWRSIGPFRGGRTRAVAGVPSQPNVFYMAQVNGGVWKTEDYGHTWTPIFDDQPTGSVGSIAVATSDPNV